MCAPCVWPPWALRAVVRTGFLDASDIERMLLLTSRELTDVLDHDERWARGGPAWRVESLPAPFVETAVGFREFCPRHGEEIRAPRTVFGPAAAALMSSPYGPALMVDVYGDGR